MTFDVNETYDIANRIFQKESSEAGYRSSTNRAYYSAYHSSCIVASKLKYKPSNAKYANFGHAELINRLKQHSSFAASPQQAGNLCKLARLLRIVRDLRSKADYQDGISYSYNQARDALVQSGSIRILAKNLP